MNQKQALLNLDIEKNNFITKSIQTFKEILPNSKIDFYYQNNLYLDNGKRLIDLFGYCLDNVFEEIRQEVEKTYGEKLSFEVTNKILYINKNILKEKERFMAIRYNIQDFYLDNKNLA